MNGKLYRSQTDQMIAGVCGGLGAYLQIDPILVRLFFVLLTIGGGSGVLIYVILWILIPYPEQGELATSATIRAGAEEIAGRARTLGDGMRNSMRDNQRTGLLVGATLVLLGFMFLAQSLQIAWLRWLNTGVLWPLLLIAFGAVLIWRRMKGASQ